VPILFSDTVFFALCVYHSYKDIRSWFTESNLVKGEPLARRKFWCRLLVTMQAYLLESPFLSGIENLPRLVQLLLLFSDLLKLPRDLTVPSVHLDGHFRVRQADANDQQETNSEPVVAVGEFLWRGSHDPNANAQVTLTVKYFQRHVLSAASAVEEADDEDFSRDDIRGNSEVEQLVNLAFDDKALNAMAKQATADTQVKSNTIAH
jgi:hypothetical protein